MVKGLYCCSDYLVDDSGFVLSKRSGKPLKPSTNHHGYQIITIMVDGKRKSMAVHTAVAKTFLDGYEDGMQVNHKDGNKTNNSIKNLEYVTAAENVRHSICVLGHDGMSKNNPNARAVRGYNKDSGELMYEFDCIADAGRCLGMGDSKKARRIQNSIWKAVNHIEKRHTYRGCRWEYVEVAK